MKPPILTNVEVWQSENKRRGGNLPATHIVNREESKEAQRDADASYYEPLIEQAKELEEISTYATRLICGQ